MSFYRDKLRRGRLLPLAALYAGGVAAVVCAVWAYAIQPDRPAPRGVVPVMEFVVPSEFDEPLVDRTPRIVPAIQRETTGADIMREAAIRA